MPVHFIVSDQIEEIIIGVDWMKLNRCIISCIEHTLTIQGCCFPLARKAVVGLCHRVILGESVELPAKSEAIVGGRVVYANLRRSLPKVWIAESKEYQPGVRTARCLVDVEGGDDVPLRMLNTNDGSVLIPAGAEICSLQEVRAVVENTPLLTETKDPVQQNVTMDHIQGILDGVSPDVTAEQRRKITRIIDQVLGHPV